MPPVPHDSPHPSDNEEEELFELENVIDLDDEDYDPGDDLDDMELGEENDEEENGYFQDDAVMVFSKHEGSVFSCDISPADNQYAVTGGEDDTAYVWNTTTGEVHFQCTGHVDSVISCGFSSDGKYVSSADMGGLIVVWKVADGSKVWSFECSDIEWSRWHTSAPVLFCGTCDGEVYMFKIPSGDCKICQGHGSKSTVGQLMPDGKHLVVGYEDGAVKMWELKSTTAVFSTAAPTSGTSSKGEASSADTAPVSALDLSASGSLIAVGHLDGDVQVLNHLGKHVANFRDSTDSAPNDNEEEIEEGGSMGVESVTFSPDQQFLASARLNGCITVWDVAQKRERARCKLDCGVTKMIWESDTPEQMLIAACLDGTIQTLDGKSGERSARQWCGHQADLLDMQLSRDGKLLISCSDDQTARVFVVSNDDGAAALD